jgi:hypothetical protein
MSFPPFRFKDIVAEQWEGSELREYFYNTKFLFVVFKAKDDDYVLQGCLMWHMPISTLDGEVHRCWSETQQTIIDGVDLIPIAWGKGTRINNNLPGRKGNPVMYVRPHTEKSYYVLEGNKVYGSGGPENTFELPDGRKMTKQCFWLNNTYIAKILADSGL